MGCTFWRADEIATVVETAARFGTVGTGVDRQHFWRQTLQKAIQEKQHCREQGSSVHLGKS